MPHNAIIGTTRCGKTSLAKLLAERVRRSGVHVCVLDPHYDTWPADFQTHDPEKFLRVLPRLVATRKRWALFIDESSRAVDRHDRRFDFLGTGAAKTGLVTYFICQYPKQINPELRNSCEVWWVFKNDGAAFLSKKLCEPKIDDVATFGKGEFLLSRPFTPLLYGRLTWGKKTSIDLKPYAGRADQSHCRQ